MVEGNADDVKGLVEGLRRLLNRAKQGIDEASNRRRRTLRHEEKDQAYLRDVYDNSAGVLTGRTFKRR